MITPANYDRVVQTAIASRRIGTPVFVRFMLLLSNSPKSAPGTLAVASSRVRSWLDQTIESIFALGRIDTGQVSLTMRFAAGATALVTLARSPKPGPAFDLMILGTKGAIHHDPGHAQLVDEPFDEPAGDPDPLLVRWIEQALRTAKPVKAHEVQP